MLCFFFLFGVAPLLLTQELQFYFLVLQTDLFRCCLVEQSEKPLAAFHCVSVFAYFPQSHMYGRTKRTDDSNQPNRKSLVLILSMSATYNM